ncbi:MAG: hypothetical protein ACLQVK_08045 [Acidimicrobiales bacterium]
MGRSLFLPAGTDRRFNQVQVDEQGVRGARGKRPRRADLACLYASSARGGGLGLTS